MPFLCGNVSGDAANCLNRVAVGEVCWTVTQGGRVAATLGFAAQPPWGWATQRRPRAALCLPWAILFRGFQPFRLEPGELRTSSCRPAAKSLPNRMTSPQASTTSGARSRSSPLSLSTTFRLPDCRAFSFTSLTLFAIAPTVCRERGVDWRAANVACPALWPTQKTGPPAAVECSAAGTGLSTRSN
jgi:hypothetical protein